MSVTRYRIPASVAGAALLAVAATGCSGLGRTAVGTVIYETSQHHAVVVSNPLVRGCHRLDPPGAVNLHNNTLVDLVLYPADDCSGGNTVYVATTTSDVVAPGAGAWRSYTTIH
ncbi:hypothetical protein [Streptomyces jumonjinensis]|uniref:hypothetical protein n=1 Tax=Streptomyces jumonjinensis TaxID=1945 RepID=UPI00378FF806